MSGLGASACAFGFSSWGMRCGGEEVRVEAVHEGSGRPRGDLRSEGWLPGLDMSSLGSPALLVRPRFLVAVSKPGGRSRGESRATLGGRAWFAGDNHGWPPGVRGSRFSSSGAPRAPSVSRRGVRRGGLAIGGAAGRMGRRGAAWGRRLRWSLVGAGLALPGLLVRRRHFVAGGGRARFRGGSEEVRSDGVR